MSTSTAKPAVIITCLYPRVPEFSFNTDYYLSTHIPLAKELWGPLGMGRVSVAEVTGSPDYAYKITIEFKDLESWETALEDESTRRLGDDGKNFTNSKPVFIAGNVIG
ncbi:hypothetical protein DM02DRAFT_619208 [Periconia macrospinosa]|uniref:EthD domain-containing protein n=1 Tax=Periconia macrospinosa TaxID=97972 RepID=A0A2V1D696_9PLEO|nr:hypothetical protein DM02DRAFT_619208 [Periconia macrospinosa]